METVINTPFLDRLSPRELINLCSSSTDIRNSCYAYLPSRTIEEFKYVGPTREDPFKTYIFAATNAGNLVPGSEEFIPLNDVIFKAGTSNDEEIISYLLSKYDVLPLIILSLAVGGHDVSQLMEGRHFSPDFMMALDGIMGKMHIWNTVSYANVHNFDPLYRYALAIGEQEQRGQGIRRTHPISLIRRQNY